MIASSASTSAACTTRSPASSPTSSTRSATESISPRSTNGSEAERRGDAARAEEASRRAEERRLDLDLLPDDLAGKVDCAAAARLRLGGGRATLRGARRASALALGDAGVRADERLDAVAEPAIAGSAGGDARRSQRDARPSSSAARIRASTSSWPATATSSPSSRGDIDELLDALARRAAAMQALLNSMTPEQRDELHRLSEALLDDAGLREQISQLGEQLRALAPGSGWNSAYDFSGERRPRPRRGPRHDGRARRSRPSRVVASRRDVAGRASPRSTPSVSASCSATTRCARCSGSPSSPGGWPTPG